MADQSKVIIAAYYPGGHPPATAFSMESDWAGGRLCKHPVVGTALLHVFAEGNPVPVASRLEAVIWLGAETGAPVPVSQAFGQSLNAYVYLGIWPEGEHPDATQTADAKRELARRSQPANA